MRKRPLGATPLKVTELCLGTWGLSGDGYGSVPEIEQDRVIDRALAMGIRAFDTADCYARGAMETRLGQRLPRGGATVVITKLGTRRDEDAASKDFSPAYLKEAFERSRERLARDVVDCVLLHNPSAKAFQDPDLAATLQELQSKGWITTWGASVGSIEAGRAAIVAGARVLELAFNVFHTRELGELQSQITERSVGVLARSVLSHGLLCGLWPTGKDFPPTDHRAERWSPDELRLRVMQLNAVRTLISETTPTLRSIALRFALSNPAVSAVVIGPRNALQLDQIVREAGRGPIYLEPERIDSLRERLLSIGVST
jgi:aryl-alcohol dehydrogenase-like predicted oxidoreductase